MIAFNPRPSRAPRARQGFTLIEVMIVVAILGIIISIATSTWMRQRAVSQQRVCQENLTKINGAKQQWALEKNQASTATPTWGDLVSADGSSFLKKTPVCPADGTYTLGSLDEDATCSITSPDDHNATPNSASATPAP